MAIDTVLTEIQAVCLPSEIRMSPNQLPESHWSLVALRVQGSVTLDAARSATCGKRGI